MTAHSAHAGMAGVFSDAMRAADPVAPSVIERRPGRACTVRLVCLFLREVRQLVARQQRGQGAGDALPVRHRQVAVAVGPGADQPGL